MGKAARSESIVRQTYIFSYSARLNGRSTSGHVEAITAAEAIQIVKAHNEMLSNISVKVLKNQDLARKQSYIK